MTWRLRHRRRRPSIEPADLAAWCDALARALRGGATLHHALRIVTPPDCVAGALAPVVLSLDRGAPVATALAGVDVGSPHLDLVLVVLRAVAEHGGDAAEPIDRAASALRQRAALIGERRTQSAQARLSAIVMTFLPVVMLAVMIVSSGPVRAVLGSPVGVGAIAAGALLNLVGWSWMKRLIAGRRP